MSSFVSDKKHTREALFFCFHLKKKVVEARLLLGEAYCEHALSKTTREDWFKHFKSGDFDIEDKIRTGIPKLIEDTEFQSLLDENDSQTQLAPSLNVSQQSISKSLNAMGKIHKEEK